MRNAGKPQILRETRERTEKTMSPHRLQLTAILCFTGAGLVLAARLVRILPVALPPWLSFINGVLPNFGGALFVPFVILTLADAWARRSTGKKPRIPAFGFILPFSFLGLTAWEYIQHAVWNLPIDPFDIAASAAGTVVSAILWSILPD
jgi:hypothetical protein